MGPQGTRGPAGIVDEFELLSFDVTRSLYSNGNITLADSKISTATVVQVYVLSRELINSNTGDTISTYVPFDAYIEDKISSIYGPKIFIGEGFIFISDDDDDLLGETIVVIVLP